MCVCVCVCVYVRACDSPPARAEKVWCKLQLCSQRQLTKRLSVHTLQHPLSPSLSSILHSHSSPFYLSLTSPPSSSSVLRRSITSTFGKPIKSFNAVFMRRRERVREREREKEREEGREEEWERVCWSVCTDSRFVSCLWEHN